MTEQLALIPSADVVPPPPTKRVRRNRHDLDQSIDIFSNLSSEEFFDRYGKLTMTTYRAMCDNERYWIQERAKKEWEQSSTFSSPMANLIGVVTEWAPETLSPLADGAVERGVFDRITLDTDKGVNDILAYTNITRVRERRTLASGYVSSPTIDDQINTLRPAYTSLIPSGFNRMRRAQYEAFLLIGGTDEEFCVEKGDEYTKSVDSSLRPIMKLFRRKNNIEIPRGNNSGFDMVVSGRSFEEKKKMVGPWCDDNNSWVTNSYSKTKLAPHILVSYDCDRFGYIVGAWIAIVELSCRKDGTGDVKFSPQTAKKSEADVNSAWASLKITWEIVSRPSFCQLHGEIISFKEKRSDKFRQVPKFVSEKVLTL